MAPVIDNIKECPISKSGKVQYMITCTVCADVSWNCTTAGGVQEDNGTTDKECNHDLDNKRAYTLLFTV